MLNVLPAVYFFFTAALQITMFFILDLAMQITFILFQFIYTAAMQKVLIFFFFFYFYRSAANDIFYRSYADNSAL